MSIFGLSLIRQWHPTMIHLAILLHSRGKAAYQTLRKSRALKLPGSSTRHEYTNVMHPREGFEHPVQEELQSAPDKLEPHRHFVILLHDEMSVILHDEMSVILLHDEMSVILLHDETSVILLHDEMSVVLLHDEMSVILLHDEMSVILLHDEMSVILLHDEMSVILLHDEMSVILLHDEMSVILLHDEMSVILLHDGLSITHDLVFGKRSGALAGFVNRGTWSFEGGGERLATQALAFFIAGINCNIKMSLGFFGTRSANTDELCPLFRQAVAVVEETGRKVMISTSNKAQANQRLYQMHGHDGRICHKTLECVLARQEHLIHFRSTSTCENCKEQPI